MALLLVIGGVALVVVGVFFWPLLPVGIFMILGGVFRLLRNLARAPGRAARRRNARNEKARRIAMKRQQAAIRRQPPMQAVPHAINPGCGHSVLADAMFCPVCGAPTPNATTGGPARGH